MCARCAELEEEVAYLRSELGVQQDASLVDILKVRFGLVRGWAALLAALYRAKGRCVMRAQLEEAIPNPNDRDRDDRIVSVYIALLRGALGKDAIATVWGSGYRLTESGLERVEAVLSTLPQRKLWAARCRVDNEAMKGSIL